MKLKSATSTIPLCYIAISFFQGILCNSLDSDIINKNIFIETLFYKYGNGSVMTLEGFEHLMNGIQLGNIILEDSLKEHREGNQTDFKKLHQQNHSHVVDTDKHINTRTRRHVVDTDKHIKTRTRRRVVDTDKHIKTRTRRHESSHLEGHNDHDHIIPYQENSDPVKTKDPLKTCLSPYEILEIFRLKADSVITYAEFYNICPALINQLDNRRCLSLDVLIRYRDFKVPETVGKKAWVHGFISIATISVIGLLLVLIVPLLQKLCFDGILQFLIALAIGALTGDALLHLIPHAIAPMSHDHGDSVDHSHQNVYKGLCGLGAMFFFFIIGRIQTISANKSKKNELNETKSQEYTKKLNVDGADTVNFNREYKYEHNTNGHSHTHVIPSTVSGMIWRVIVGDGLHNFSDGLAIGVGFASSTAGGISTSIAILCHEIPHEMGDFALLLQKGVPVKRAILFNCLSSLLSCLGMVIGIAVGNIGDLSLWIFVAIAGMFIYISLVDMVPELTTTTEDGNSWLRLVLQVCGWLMGSSIMFIIAVCEEKLTQMIK